MAGFDPSQPSELVSAGFNPNAPSEPVSGPPNTATETALPSPASTPPDWHTLFSGLDKLDEKLTPAQTEAFSQGDKIGLDPQNTRAKAVVDAYLGSKGVSQQAIDASPEAAYGAYAEQALGQKKGKLDAKSLYGLIGQQMTDTAFAQKQAWKNAASPYEGFKLMMGSFPEHFGEHSLDVVKEMYESGTKPFKELPSAPSDLPNAWVNGPGGLPYNPALAGAVYNAAVKPLVEGLESPIGLASLAVGGEAGAAVKAGKSGGKAALVAMNGAFAALMAKTLAKNTGPAYRTLTDPNSSFQAKAEAIISEVTTALGGVGSSLAALHVVAPEALSGLKGEPGEDAAHLSEEAKKAPPEKVDALETAARRLDEVSPPKKETEFALAMNELRRIFAPSTLSEESGQTANLMREMGGARARRIDIATAALESVSKALMKLPVEDRWAFIDRLENGQQQPTPQMQAFAGTIREILDSRLKEVQDLGTGKLEHFIEDYFPHLWKDPEAAQQAFNQAKSKAPLQGAKSFLKARTIPTIADGRALGLEPVSTNPVEMLMLRVREMDKYITAQRLIAELKDREFVKYVRSGEKPPLGFEEIKDSIATVYGQGSHPGAMQIEGKYYAPADIAAVMNNYLSPGLRKYATFRGYMSLSNSMNQFQLGLSFFHLGFVTLETSISRVSLALQQLEEGVRSGSPTKVGKAAKTAAGAATAPFTTAIQGNRVLREWARPGTAGGDIAQLADAYMKGGGRANMDPIYETSHAKKLMEALRSPELKTKLGSLWRAPFAAIEQISHPLMGWLVPRMKAGVAANMMRFEMERLGVNATEDQLRAAFAKVIDSVDNRMGQMVYDNLFWHKTMKDLSMAAVRSVGWDLGTIRELGGGVSDGVKYVKDAMTPGEKAKFTARMSYTMGLPLTVGAIGAAMNYLLTGKGPQELRDYFFPKTGEKDPQGRDVRLALPSYMKDVYHYGHAPWQTLEGKVSPFPSIVIEMLNNKDYYGKDIRNADDPLVQQLQDEATFFLKTYNPISIRGFETSAAAGVSPGERVANFVGVSRAPAWVGETDAEQLAGKLAGDKFKSTDSPDSKKVLDRQRIMAELRNGNDAQKASAKNELETLVENGELTPKQRQNIIKGNDHTYLENAVTHLDAKEAVRVYRVASPAERADIEQAVRHKVNTAHLPPEDKALLKAQFERYSQGLPQRNIDHSER